MAAARGPYASRQVSRRSSVTSLRSDPVLTFSVPAGAGLTCPIHPRGPRAPWESGRRRFGSLRLLSEGPRRAKPPATLLPFRSRWIIHAMEHELRVRSGDQPATDLCQLSPSEVKQLLLDVLQPQQNGRSAGPLSPAGHPAPPTS